MAGIVALAVVSSCQKKSETTYGEIGRILVTNVITMDKDCTVAQAVAFKDGKILFVGSNEDVKKYRGKRNVVNDYGTANNRSCIYNPAQKTILFKMRNDMSQIYKIDFNKDFQ